MKSTASRSLGTVRVLGFALLVMLFTSVSLGAAITPALGASSEAGTTAPGDHIGVGGRTGLPVGVTLLGVQSSYQFSLGSYKSPSVLDAIEHYHLDFGSERIGTGLDRTIADAASIASVRVTNGNYAEVPFTSRKEGDSLVVAIDPASLVSGPREYILLYTRTGVDGMTHWTQDVIDDSWNTAIPVVSASIAVPVVRASSVASARCERDSGACDIVAGSSGAIWTATVRDIAAGEHVSLSIALSGATTGSGSSSAVLSGDRYLPGAIALTVGGVMLTVFSLLRRLRRRLAASTGRPIIAEYAPPDDLNIMVAAHLLDRSRAAIPAQLLVLTTQHNLRFIERRYRRGSTGYAVQFLSMDKADALSRDMLTAIFGPHPVPEEIKELRTVDWQLTSRMSKVCIAAIAEAADRGWRGRASVSQWLNLISSGVAVVLALIIVLLTAVLGGPFSPWIWAAQGATLVAFPVSFFSLRFQGPLTPSGALVRDHLLGIRMYLRLAEKDRLRMLQSVTTAERTPGTGGTSVVRLYEKLLPYAVVWGVEDSWLRELIGTSTESQAPPEWLSNPNTLTALGFWTRAMSGWQITPSTIEAGTYLLTRVNPTTPPSPTSPPPRRPRA